MCSENAENLKTRKLSVYRTISGPQKGPVARGPRQKTSKIFKKCQKDFRYFSTFSAQAKKRQKSSKVSKIFSTLFDIFRAAPVFRPLLGGSEAIPNKNGSHAVKVGVRMAQKSGFVCHILCVNPFLLQKGNGYCVRHTTPHFMAYFSVIFFCCYGGVGVFKIVFELCDLHSVPKAAAIFLQFFYNTGS